MKMKAKYLEQEYSGYTLWDDIEEYEHHEVEKIVRIQAAVSKTKTQVLLVVSHGNEHPLSGLPEERTFLELTMEQFHQLSTSIKGIEQGLGKR